MGSLFLGRSLMTPAPLHIPDELRDLAVAVRRIGCGYRENPETIAAAKDTIAKQLAKLARHLENAA